jgi:eukaryotic-like serine/threonine-protein kinase
VLARIGAGGMGVVYGAYDPDLDRRVAIKLLRRDLSGRHSRSDGRAALLREAQAMARLSHPHVVTVHDVGVHEGRVFLAMELVQGRTLREWLDEGPHPWREVIAMLSAAGLGLEAAHECGLVHRDFKPENILLGDDGSIKVNDFGLAHRDGEPARSKAPVAPHSSRGVEVPAGLQQTIDSFTHSGAVVGTPAYMAPEQHLGLSVDPRTDQFSFCIVLHEALYGVRPFTGESLAHLVLRVTEGDVDEAPAGANVPAWLRQIVLRGLQPAPEARWPSMAALLAELTRDPGAMRRRRALMVGVPLGIATMAVAMHHALGSAEKPCTRMDRHLLGVWDDETRAEVEQALLGTGVGFAQSSWNRVRAALDDYAASWVEQRSEACEATHVHHEQSEAVLDLRMECLDRRLEALRAVIGVLGDADEVVVENAIGTATGLPPLEHCVDAQALREAMPVPASAAEEIAAIEAALAQADAKAHAGKFADALALARELTENAERVAYPPLLARALRRRGLLEREIGDEAAAEATLEAAFFVSIRHDLDEISAQAAADLASLIGEGRARAAEGHRWAAHASAYADATGREALQALVLQVRGGIAHKQGEYEQARALVEEALAIRERVLGPEHASVLGSINTLGLVASDTGRYNDARELFERGLERGEKALGADHPNLAKFINNLAKIAYLRGDYAGARASFERALLLLEGALGPEHRHVAQLHNNLAAVATASQDYDEATRRFELALAIWREALGPEHPAVADALSNLGVVSGALGDAERALEYDEQALAIRNKTMEPDHPDLAQNYCNIGSSLHRLGRLDEARAMHEKALAIYEAKLEPHHDDIAMALTALGRDWIELGQPEQALPLLERALKMRENAPIDALQRAETHWTLARALTAVPRAKGRDVARAIELARRARPALVDAGSAERATLEALDAWLQAHEGPH